MRWWPRSIRSQMLVGLILLELLSIALFTLLVVVRLETREHLRIRRRLAHEAESVALQAAQGLERGHHDWIAVSVRMMGNSPSVAIAVVTDPAGRIVAVSEGDPASIALEREERARLAHVRHQEPYIFEMGSDRWVGIRAIYVGGWLRGYAIVETDRDWDHQQQRSLLTSLSLFAFIWMAASVALVFFLARSISRPLRLLHAGTRALMNAPENVGAFPLPVNVQNEIGELIEAFNRMVASIEEQRVGLNDTLSLLDSMLANAPIGLAFFDRRCRFVRVNRVFAGMSGIPIGRHLGRTLPEVLQQPVADMLEAALTSVFASEQPVRDLELSGTGFAGQRQWTWLASAYPVRPAPGHVRWVGVIVLDASERKQSEEALRRSEKLAATGRQRSAIG